MSLVLEGGSLATRSAEQEDERGTVGPDSLVIDVAMSLEPEPALPFLSSPVAESVGSGRAESTINTENGQKMSGNVEGELATLAMEQSQPSFVDEADTLKPSAGEINLENGQLGGAETADDDGVVDDSMLLVDPMILEHMDASLSAVKNATENAQEVRRNQEGTKATTEPPPATVSTTMPAPIVSTTALNVRPTQTAQPKVGVSVEPKPESKDEAMTTSTNRSSSINQDVTLMAKTIVELTEGQALPPELANQLEIVNFGSRGRKT